MTDTYSSLGASWRNWKINPLWSWLLKVHNFHAACPQPCNKLSVTVTVTVTVSRRRQKVYPEGNPRRMRQFHTAACEHTCGHGTFLCVLGPQNAQHMNWTLRRRLKACSISQLQWLYLFPFHKDLNKCIFFSEFTPSLWPKCFFFITCTLSLLNLHVHRRYIPFGH